MNKTALSLSLLVLGIALFYWFQIKPAETRKNCEHYAGSKEDTSYDSGKRRANNLYRQCLIKNGMPAASIFVNVE